MRQESIDFKRQLERTLWQKSPTWDAFTLEAFASTITVADTAIREVNLKRWQSLCKPLFSLGYLEEAVTKIATAQHTLTPKLERVAIIEFCGDHGVVDAGVTQAGQEVTAEVLRHFVTGETTANIMAKRQNVDLYAVDLGVCHFQENHEQVISHRLMPNGTQNLYCEAAMPSNIVYQAMGAGIALASELASDYDVFIGGEMGIGNTTASTALICALLGGDVDTWTGRGSGLTDAALVQKKHVISTAITRLKTTYSNVSTWQICSEVGGLEIIALAGLYLGAAKVKKPILLDGVISLAALSIAHAICPCVLDYLVATHAPREQAAREALANFRLKPWLNASLAAGEGVGGLIALSELRLVAEVFTGLCTFAEGNVEAYQKLSEVDV